MKVGGKAMTAKFDSADVPTVAASDLYRPMEILIASGQALALLKGLSKHELRDLEHAFWHQFEDDPHTRLAVALRFRALADAFAARRLKNMLIERGFKVIAAAIVAASEQRLNAHFGFNAQRLLIAIEAATRPVQRPAFAAAPMKAAA
jgi:hypothetical protein